MIETTAGADWRPLLAAVRQAVDAELRQTRQAAQLRQRSNPVARIDVLLDKLEQVHLKDRVRVPTALLEEIRATLAELPGCAEEFAPRATVVSVIDRLFALQDRLLTQRNQHRAALQRLDEVLEAANAL